jgi:hypothetical protein
MEKTYPPGAFRIEAAACAELRWPVRSVMNSSPTFEHPAPGELHGSQVSGGTPEVVGSIAISSRQPAHATCRQPASLSPANDENVETLPAADEEEDDDDIVDETAEAPPEPELDAGLPEQAGAPRANHTAAHATRNNMGADRSGRNNSFVISIIWIAI